MDAAKGGQLPLFPANFNMGKEVTRYEKEAVYALHMRVGYPPRNAHIRSLTARVEARRSLIWL